MLTIEMLSQSAALSGLTEAQRDAIIEMSKNDENTVIATKIGTLHGQYDADILSISGIAKNAGEKSYDYAKRVLSEYKTQNGSVTDLQAKLKAADDKVAELNKKIENGEGDTALRQQLKDAKTSVVQLQAQLQSKETEYNNSKIELEKKIQQTHVDYAFAQASSGLKFKAGITEPIQKALIDAAKTEVLAKGTPEYTDGKLVIRDANGNILANPKNNLNPYTISELISETSLKDALDAGRQQPGAGTSAAGGAGTASGTFDISGCRTQVEADKAIASHLLASGITRDSREFSDQSLKLRTENNVSELPIR